MKLCTFGAPGAEKAGLVDSSGRLRDYSAHAPCWTVDHLAPAALARLAGTDLDALPLVAGTPRRGQPFFGTRQFIAVGLNYSDHAAEAGMAVPAEPILFTKAVSCIQGPDDPVRRPPGSRKMDWEVELGVVIGSEAHDVPVQAALGHVAGYLVVDDLSEREFQLERGGSWDKGKGCPTFGPIGPWLVTRDEVPDPQRLGLWLEVNGKRRQAGNTATMIFDCATLVSYVSRFMRLLPGDIITTGTPPGVGMGHKPPVFLEDGDVIRLGIEGLGVQQHTVVASGHGR